MTPEKVATALQGFRLPLAAGRTMEWLALATRRVLSIVSPRPEGMPDRLLSNAEKRERLNGIAARITQLSAELHSLDNDTLSILSITMDDASWQSFWEGARYLEFMSDVMTVCAQRLVQDKAKWRTGAKRELRVRQAHYLSPIYELAYQRGATFNDRDGAKDNGPWPDFFARIIMLAEGEEVADLRGVLKEARKRHISGPLDYPDTFIPK